ncbi:MAG: hypothetical protein AAGC65_10505 [Mucilaginibacter sp.]|uniref:hypothetical protein n=1 Tax=Mucilaginibacter sp. TaxID=1882438 RepID=UPI0031A71FAB
MKTLNLVIAFILIQISYALAQDTTSIMQAMRKGSIFRQAAKYIELKDVPDHIGDTVCVYGHIREIKEIPGVNGFIVSIDSASKGRSVAVEISYLYEAAKPSVLKALKKHDIEVYGVVNGNREKPIITNSVFMADDKSAFLLSSFKSRLQFQKDGGKKPSTRVTSVELLPPSREAVKASSYKYFSERVNKKIWYSDSVSDAKFYVNEMLTELYLSNETLVVIIKGEVRNKFHTIPEVAFLNKQISIKGRVIPYKGKFAVNITNPKQIELIGY